jgi:hypothetical protein
MPYDKPALFLRAYGWLVAGGWWLIMMKWVNELIGLSMID